MVSGEDQQGLLLDPRPFCIYIVKSSDVRPRIIHSQIAGNGLKLCFIVR